MENSVLIKRDDELIEQDTQFIADILPLGNDLCREILAYPLPITLTGGFSEVIAAIQEQVPTHSSPRGKFDLGEYVNAATGQPIMGFGHRLIREFENMQREVLYEKTGGKISEDITLERDAFLTSVRPKAGRPIVEATHRVLAYLNNHPDCAERCSGLLFFRDGSLQTVPDCNALIFAYHSIYASDYQKACLEAARPHFEALADIAKEFDSYEAIRDGVFATDLTWLLKVGDDGETIAADNDEQSDGMIGGMDEDGRPRSGRNTVFTFD